MQKAFQSTPKTGGYTEFLRTGRLARDGARWSHQERRYLSYAEVAERTGQRLEAAGERSHEKLNSFYKSIQFPKLVFHRTLNEMPHLGYCHVTATRSMLPTSAQVSWSFYIANFFSELGGSDGFFGTISRKYSRMYFAVALERDPGEPLKINRRLRKNGILFQTHDPKKAVHNVLLLGAPNETMREIIRGL